MGRAAAARLHEDTLPATVLAKRRSCQGAFCAAPVREPTAPIREHFGAAPRGPWAPLLLGSTRAQLLSGSPGRRSYQGALGRRTYQGAFWRRPYQGALRRSSFQGALPARGSFQGAWRAVVPYQGNGELGGRGPYQGTWHSTCAQGALALVCNSYQGEAKPPLLVGAPGTEHHQEYFRRFQQPSARSAREPLPKKQTEACKQRGDEASTMGPTPDDFPVAETSL